MSEADDEVTKATDISWSVKLVPNAKCNAENQKKEKVRCQQHIVQVRIMSLLWSEQIAEDKNYKFMQLSIEERKFSIEECKSQAELEWEERNMGMLEQELTIKMEKLKAETEKEQLHIDKEC